MLHFNRRKVIVPKPINFIDISTKNLEVLNDSGQIHIRPTMQNNGLYEANYDSEFCQSSINFTNKYGLTYLHTACLTNNFKVVKILLQNGADVNALFHCSLHDAGYRNYTPLHFAAVHASVDIVNILLKSGADVHAVDISGQTPLHMACQIRKWYVDQKFKNRHRESGLKSYFGEEYKELLILKLLLDHKSNLNARDKCGNTPLLHIIKNDYYKIVKSKLSDISLFDLTPIRVTLRQLRNMQTNKLRFLLAKGARIDLTKIRDKLILHFAIHDIKKTRICQNLKYFIFDDESTAVMVELLLRAGADIEAKNKNLETPLQVAIKLMSADVVEVLLKYNADVNSVKLQIENSEYFYYPKLLPCYETVDNLIQISNLLSGLGLLSIEIKLAILKFFIFNIPDYNYLEDVQYKITNILNYGTAESVERLLHDCETKPYSTYIPLIILHIKRLECAKIYRQTKLMEFLKRHSKSYYLHPILSIISNNELKGLKLKILRNGKSVYDLLLTDPYKLNPSIIDECKQILTADTYSSDYTIYGHSIKGHFAKCLIRRYVLDLGQECLVYMTGIPIPYLCSDKIFNYLTNEEIWKFGLAFCTVTVSS